MLPGLVVMVTAGARYSAAKERLGGSQREEYVFMITTCGSDVQTHSSNNYVC